MSCGGAGGFYPIDGVVLLVDFPVIPVDRLFLVGFARVTNEPGVLSKLCTALACGQGRYAAPMVCLIPRPQWVGSDCVNFFFQFLLCFIFFVPNVLFFRRFSLQRFSFQLFRLTFKFFLIFKFSMS